MDAPSFYGKKRNPSLAEILDSAEDGTYRCTDNSDNFVVTIVPPDNACGEVTDEDSGDEDGGGTINNLPGSMLRSEVPILECDDNEPPTKKSKSSRKWIKKDIESKIPTWEPTENSHLQQLREKELDPKDYFELFFDDALISLIVNKSNLYAAQKNKNLQVTDKEMRCYLGILMLSGYVTVPRKRMYWENSSDTKNKLVVQAMRRDRFFDIMSNLHFADNTNLDQDDKYAKLRPLINHLNEKFKKYGPIEEFYSFDESMCEYFGRHPSKQFMRGKPIRVGYKNWCATTTLGYLLCFEFYQGKSREPRNENKKFGLGENLVLKFADILHEHAPKPFHLCFDNFFTSVKLMEALSEKSIKATGTIRENRQEKCPLKKKEVMKKQQRGSYDYRTDDSKEIILVRWNDNNVVDICSNAVGVEPCSQASRYLSTAKSRMPIQCPRLVKVYNEHMGGVDRMDQNISKYRIGIRGKKWYFSLFSYMVDVAVNNAWQLYRMHYKEKKMDLLGFHRSVVMYYLQRFGTPSHQGQSGRPQTSLQIEATRFDNHGHWVIPQEKQTRCAHCHTKTTTRCEKCDRGLHVKCFKEYHIR